MIFNDLNTILIDAKWKILSDNPNDDDIFKLERDYLVRNNSNITNFLIYPSPVNFDISRNENSYQIDYSMFKFKTIEPCGTMCALLSFPMACAIEAGDGNTSPKNELCCGL